VITIGPNKKLIIEVTSVGVQRQRRLSEIQGRFANQKEWEFTLVWMGNAAQEAPVSRSSAKNILERTEEVRKLIQSGHHQPALLMSWGLLEAVGRLLHTTIIKPQSPARLIQILASEGSITPAEADLLRQSSKKRNAVIHGDIAVEVSSDELLDLLKILRSLLRLTSKEQRGDEEA
jgi:uncharacterized protein YutE (UPF0331/DUF86 family)